MIDAAEASAQWRIGTVTAIWSETSAVKTIAFDVPDWPGHLPGQHLDIRLTAADGYVAQRSYSIASAPERTNTIQITVAAVPDGEASEFLLEELRIGDRIELRGPIGRYFAWSPDHDHGLLLVAGGSGIVPLMAILRTRAAAGAVEPARLLYSSRTVDQIIYRDELDTLAARGDGLTVTQTLTRGAPPGWTGERGRIGRIMLKRQGFAPDGRPDIYVCGPTAFVETVAEHLTAIGHAPGRIRTERFGPSGEFR
ncbi:ferredoxin reductase [Sphingomonas sp.]|uniref:ferredoxin reductase n=1 Tax=Sphingomonas sp. TaxID=28214 RepID=UPI003B3AEC93